MNCWEWRKTISVSVSIKAKFEYVYEWIGYPDPPPDEGGGGGTGDGTGGDTGGGTGGDTGGGTGGDTGGGTGGDTGGGTGGDTGGGTGGDTGGGTGDEEDLSYTVKGEHTYSNTDLYTNWTPRELRCLGRPAVSGIPGDTTSYVLMSTDVMTRKWYIVDESLSGEYRTQQKCRCNIFGFGDVEGLLLAESGMTLNATGPGAANIVAYLPEQAGLSWSNLLYPYLLYPSITNDPCSLSRIKDLDNAALDPEFGMASISINTGIFALCPAARVDYLKDGYSTSAESSGEQTSGQDVVATWTASCSFTFTVNIEHI